MGRQIVVAAYCTVIRRQEDQQQVGNRIEVVQGLATQLFAAKGWVKGVMVGTLDCRQNENAPSLTGHFEGTNGGDQDLFSAFCKQMVLRHNVFEVSRCPGGFGKLLETYRIHFYPSWYLSDFLGPSYGQITSWGDLYFVCSISMLKRLVVTWKRSLTVVRQQS